MAVVGATLGAKLFGGSDPVGRDMVIEGVPYRIVGVLASGQIFNEEMWQDANGVLVPLETYMDRLDADHALTLISVKLRNTRDLDEVQAAMLGRARQAHHGIEDVEVRRTSTPRRRAATRTSSTRCTAGSVVLYSLAGTVLLVGGVGVLSVMLISFADRRYEIGLRKAIGADDHQILVQFLLEALVLAALGATVGTLAGQRALQSALGQVPLRAWWSTRSAWRWRGASRCCWPFTFGLYPAIRAAKLSPDGSDAVASDVSRARVAVAAARCPRRAQSALPPTRLWHTSSSGSIGRRGRSAEGRRSAYRSGPASSSPCPHLSYSRIPKYR